MEWPTESKISSATDAAGRTDLLARLVGFGLLAGLGMAIIAGVVLVPAYARFLQARHQRDCLVAANAEDQARITACRRLIEAIPEDPVLAKRIAMRQLGSVPRTERVLRDSADRAAALLQTPRRPPPAPPDPRVAAAARVLESPGKRNALVVLGVGAIVAGIVLSGSGRRRDRHVTSSPAPPAR